MSSNVLGGVTVNDELAVGAHLSVVLSGVLGETPLERADDLLTSRELELCTAKSLNSVWAVGVLATYRDENLSDSYTSSSASWLSESVSHSGLESISSSARKHLVDTEYVVWVSTDTDVVVVLSARLGEVLVACHTSSLESLRGELLLLVGDEMSNVWEGIDGCLLCSYIVDSDLQSERNISMVTVWTVAFSAEFPP